MRHAEVLTQPPAHPAITNFSMLPTRVERLNVLQRHVFTCGHTSKGIGVHDHAADVLEEQVLLKSPTGKIVLKNFHAEAYDPAIHGKITKWIEKDQPISGMKSKQDEQAFHDHRANDSSGAVEYRYGDPTDHLTKKQIEKLDEIVERDPSAMAQLLDAAQSGDGLALDWMLHTSHKIVEANDIKVTDKGKVTASYAAGLRANGSHFRTKT